MWRSPMLSTILPHEANGKNSFLFMAWQKSVELLEDSETIVVSGISRLVLSEQHNWKITPSSATWWKWT